MRWLYWMDFQGWIKWVRIDIVVIYEEESEDVDTTENMGEVDEEVV